MVAAAAYAAVLSLMHMLHQIQQHPACRRRLHLDRNQIETLRKKVRLLQDFLEDYSQRFSRDIESLARKISAVAVEAEDVIDSHVVDHQIRIGSAESDMNLSFPCEGIDNVIEKIDSIKKELMMIKEGATIQEQGRGISNPLAPPSSSNNTMVGFDERVDKIMDEIIGDERDLQVLPIVGMGGIGKTTLARNAFDNSYIIHHFDIRTWLTVSQEYSIQEILLGLLPDDLKTKEGGLGELLYKSLFDRRYLIVLDDVWSAAIWNGIKSFFPDNKNGSRIMVTTRLSNVAVSSGSRNPYVMGFLDEDKSWKLFSEKAFAKDSCPPELEEIGRKIARSCRGLPLAIVVIGGLLSTSNMTRKYWKPFAKKVNSFANSGNDDHCLKILSLSYNHLPIHLKPCFLYMRAFPEDDRIKVSKLIRLWVAEGFVKPMKAKTLEEVAQGYLKDLIERNLILIHKRTHSGRMKICGIHDLLRDLCIRESQKEHFHSVPKVQFNFLESNESDVCLLCNHKAGATTRIFPRVIVPSQPFPACCLVCDNCRIIYINYRQLNGLRVVKVIDTVEDILHPTKLRYFSIRGDGFKFVGNLIHLHWNLQTLIIGSSDVVLPSEIWELPQLRHLILERNYFPDPPLITQVDRKRSTIILNNLQTLSGIKNFMLSEDTIKRIPNLKTLRIGYDWSVKEWSYYSLHNLGRLRKLESLRLTAYELPTLKNIAFPHSLKKLTLMHCEIPWEEMTIIGSLPNLEVLKFDDYAFTGPEWNPIEGEFLQLKLLLISGCYLLHWRAEKIHFPNLEHLELRDMKYLKEIPSGIGEIEALHSLFLDSCLKSVVNSAKEMLEEQHRFGNEDLQLYVNSKLVLPGSG